MKLYRGLRQPSGRTDVYVCTYAGEEWLRQGRQPKGFAMLQYEWGSDCPGAHKLARALLSDALQDAAAADLLCDSFAADLVIPQTWPTWALSEDEVRGWVLRLLLAEHLGLSRAAAREVPPCPNGE